MYKLWKLDGLRQQSKLTLTQEDLSREEALELPAQIEDGKRQIEEHESKILSLPFFKNLSKNYQQQVIQRVIWRFDLTKGERSHKQIDFSRKGRSALSILSKAKLRDKNFTIGLSFRQMHFRRSYSGGY